MATAPLLPPPISAGEEREILSSPQRILRMTSWHRLDRREESAGASGTTAEPSHGAAAKGRSASRRQNPSRAGPGAPVPIRHLPGTGHRRVASRPLDPLLDEAAATTAETSSQTKFGSSGHRARPRRAALLLSSIATRHAPSPSDALLVTAEQCGTRPADFTNSKRSTEPGDAARRLSPMSAQPVARSPSGSQSVYWAGPRLCRRSLHHPARPHEPNCRSQGTLRAGIPELFSRPASPSKTHYHFVNTTSNVVRASLCQNSGEESFVSRLSTPDEEGHVCSLIFGFEFFYFKSRAAVGACPEPARSRRGRGGGGGTARDSGRSEPSGGGHGNIRGTPRPLAAPRLSRRNHQTRPP
ncbi:unnamed protein product [Lampetra planeri]